MATLEIKNKKSIGHLIALITVLIWGATFVSTKILLHSFSPVEILFSRFVIGYFSLWLIYPHFLGKTNLKREGILALCGLLGITLYYLVENIALVYTNASNISVIGSTAPFFTAIFTILIGNRENLSKKFFIGFIFAILGISFICFNSFQDVAINPFGDFLALIAALIWCFYSILIKKISVYKYNIIAVTRRIFFYGLLFMVPCAYVFDFNLDVSKFQNSTNLFHILFLGFFASALCFVLWNQAVKILGAIKTSVYIYLIPVITIILAAIFLNEKLTLFIFLGTVLTILGLVLSRKD